MNIKTNQSKNPIKVLELSKLTEGHKPSVFFFPILTILLLCFCSGPPAPEPSPTEHMEEIRKPNEIIQDLSSEDTGAKRQAILECMEYSIKGCIPILRTSITNDKDPGVRSVSAIALGEFQDRASISKIVKLKNDPDIYPEIIIDAFARMQDPSAAPHLVEYMDSDNHTIRLLAVDALEKCRGKSQAPVILKKAKVNRDVEKDKTYAMVLGKLGYKPAEDYLIQVAKRVEDGPTKAAALLALGRVGSKKATPILLQNLESSFAKGRENSYLSLKETKDSSSFPKLVPLLSNSDRELRFLSAGIITTMPSPSHLTKIRDVFSERNNESMAPAAKILGEWKDEVSRKPIELALVDKSSPDREELAKSLGWIGNPESEPVLWQVLEESSGEARYGAAWALGFAGTEKSVDYLIRASRSSDRKLAVTSIESLGQLRSPKSLPALLSASSDDNLAPFAIASIGLLPGDESRLALEKLAVSSKAIQSRLAIETLGQRGDKESLPVLKKIAEDKDPEKRKIARFAIKNLEAKK